MACRDRHHQSSATVGSRRCDKDPRTQSIQEQLDRVTQDLNPNDAQRLKELINKKPDQQNGFDRNTLPNGNTPSGTTPFGGNGFSSFERQDPNENTQEEESTDNTRSPSSVDNNSTPNSSGRPNNTPNTNGTDTTTYEACDFDQDGICSVEEILQLESTTDESFNGQAICLHEPMEFQGDAPQFGALLERLTNYPRCKYKFFAKELNGTFTHSAWIDNVNAVAGAIYLKPTPQIPVPLKFLRSPTDVDQQYQVVAVGTHTPPGPPHM